MKTSHPAGKKLLKRKAKYIPNLTLTRLSARVRCLKAVLLANSKCFRALCNREPIRHERRDSEIAGVGKATEQERMQKEERIRAQVGHNDEPNTSPAASRAVN
jgi:hypothetical protein